MIRKNTDLLFDFQKKFDPDLQAYVESFMMPARMESLKKTLENRTRRITLVAESLLDEHNIHALIRSSECFGLQDFHNIPYKNVNLKKNRSVNRGAFQWSHIYDYSEFENSTLACIAQLRTMNYKVYAASSSQSYSYTPQTIPLDEPIAILLGNEKRGVTEEALSLCDGTIHIPMYGFTESFNVSVAGSLLLSPVVERLRQSVIDWSISDEEKRDLYFEWIWNSIKYPNVLYKEWLVNNKSQKPKQ